MPPMHKKKRVGIENKRNSFSNRAREIRLLSEISNLLCSHFWHLKRFYYRLFLLALSLLQAWNQPRATLTDERKQLRAARNMLRAARNILHPHGIFSTRTEYSAPARNIPHPHRIFRSPVNIPFACERTST